MSDKRKDGGPAFPVDEIEELGMTLRVRSDGMSLRDWFAGQALAGLLASGSTQSDNPRNTFAVMAYRLADAMLAVRERGE